MDVVDRNQTTNYLYISQQVVHGRLRSGLTGSCDGDSSDYPRCRCSLLTRVGRRFLLIPEQMNALLPETKPASLDQTSESSVDQTQAPRLCGWGRHLLHN